MAVEQVFGGRTVWHCELDEAASKVLAHRWPGVPNLGDITKVDWSTVEPIEVLCGGFPCQDVSAAGRRAGIAAGTRSGLWLEFANVIDRLRPPIVVIENVRGLLSGYAHRAVESVNLAVGDGSGRPVLRAAGAVLGDLADLGYDAQWVTLSAASVGAPHKRERVFILAYPAGQPWCLDNGDQLRTGWPAQRPGPATGPGVVADSDNPADNGQRSRSELGWRSQIADGPVDLLPTPNASDGSGGGSHPDNRKGHSQQIADYVLLHGTSRWGKYEPVIRRWESLTRPAPSPTEPNTRGNPRLAAAFPEWMMGWPAGWVTDVPGVSRNEQLRIIGNGVVPQAAAAALRRLLALEVAA